MEKDMTWWFMKYGDDMHLYNEDGDIKDITSSDYVLPYGKYKGLSLKDITDMSYISWLKKTNKDKKDMDWYLDKIISMRQQEIS